MKLILYRDSKIQIGDVIEKSTSNDIFTYLGTLSSTIIDKMNLSKRIFDSMEVDIKINKELDNIDITSFNYAAIENKGEFFFYFVTNKSWVAESTTSFHLVLDTLNTYEYKMKIVSNTDNYQLCNVRREHRDRFNEDKKVQIDKIDEGFGTLPMVLNYTRLLGNNSPYYIAYYKSKDENARYYAQFVSKEGETLSKSVYSFTFDSKEDINENEVVIIMTSINEEFYAQPYYGTDNISHNNVNFFYFDKKSGTRLDYITTGFFIDSNTIQFTNVSPGYVDPTSSTKFKFESGTPIKMLLGVETPGGSMNLVANKPYKLTEILGDNYNTVTITDTEVETMELLSIDRLLKADSTILKITEVPYLDIDTVQPYWNESLNMLIPITYDEMFKKTMPFTYGTMYQVILPDTFGKIPHDKQYETKLLGSQFTLNQFKYDTFNYNFSLEDLDVNQGMFNVETYIPNNMSNNIAFKFDYTGITRGEFDRWLLASRNNQYPTLTNEYLEYMQNGYNYDVKNRAIQSAGNWLGTIGKLPGQAMGVAGGISGLASGRQMKQQLEDLLWEFNPDNGFFGDPGEKAWRYKTWKDASAELKKTNTSNALNMRNITNSSTSIVDSLATNIMYDIQSKEQIEQRKKDYLNSAVNVSGSDDLTLFHEYNEDNKLRFTQFKPESYITDSLYEIMRIKGYATNQYKIPDLRSRVDYNYLEATVKFKGGYYIPSFIMSDIQSEFEEGITLFHNYGGIYDLDRQYENWERKFADEPEPTPTELSNLILSGRCYVNSDGSFDKVIWSLTNPNNIKVYFNGSIYVDDETQNTISLEFDAGETKTGTKEYAGKVLYVDGVLTSDGSIETKPMSLTAKCILNDDCTFSRVEYTIKNEGDTSLTFKGKMGVDENLVSTEFTLGVDESKSGNNTDDGEAFIVEGDIK